MRGHIQKRGKDSYTIVLNGKDPATGKRRQHWLSVKGSKRDAEKCLADLLHQLDTGAYFQPGKVTTAEYLTQWLRDYVKPSLTPRGFERYACIVRVHLAPALANIPLAQLRPEHLQKLYTAKLNDGLMPRTVRYIHVVSHKALATALKWGMVSRNVADAVTPPKPGHTAIRTWDEREIATFLEASKSTRYHALFYTALFTGARRSELLALRWSDVDLLAGEIGVTRGLHRLGNGSYVFSEPKSAKSKRTIALSPSAILVLKEHHQTQKLERDMLGLPFADDSLAFCQYDGKPLRPNTVTRAWAIVAERCGVPVIRFHDARHTHASLMLKQGIHPKIVQERLGHASIQITLDTYSHVAPGLQEAAAKRFDDILAVGYNDGALQNSVSKTLAKRDYVKTISLLDINK